MKGILTVEEADFVAGFASWCGDTEATAGGAEERMTSKTDQSADPLQSPRSTLRRQYIEMVMF